MKILRGAPKVFRYLKGGSEKSRGGMGLRKLVYLKTNRREGGLLKN